MLLLKVLLLCVAGVANLIFGLLIVSRNRSLNNVSFFVLATSMSGWTLGIAAFLATNDPHDAFNWAKFYYFWPLAIAASLVTFAVTFPTGRIAGRWLGLVSGSFAALAVPLIAVNSFITERLEYHSWGKEIVLNHAEYAFYGLYLLVCFSVALLIMRYKSKRLSGLYAVQAHFFYRGFLITSTCGVIFNLLLPGLGNYKLIWLGPLFTSIFVGFIAVSIIRHKMFNIQAVVARSLGYILSLALLMTLYGTVIYFAAEHVFKIKLPTDAQLFFVVASGLTGVVFARFRRFFDRATTRIFYRDAYDPQQLFDQLNKVLVSTVDLDRLLLESSHILQRSLKADYCIIGIQEADSHTMHVLGTQRPTFSATDIAAARRITPKIHRSVINADYLEEQYASLKVLLQRNNIAVMVRLTPNVRRSEEGLGYIVLGPKKSGNAYSAQDIQVLDTVSNQVIIAVQNALRYEEIKNFTVTLQAKVDEATRKLRHTNDKLRELDDAKDDFVSMASHQLRTPLTSIKGYTSMVLEGDAGKINATQRKLLEQSFISSQRMVYLIADLLNVSRLKTGKFVIEPAPVNLAEVVQQEIGQLTETAAGRSLTLSYQQPSKFPTLLLDETKTRQVIMNFVDNAIYYTPAGGDIRVELQETASAVELRVTDNGIGVPKSERPHLFTKFYRAGNARTARPDGTGLGLFMAKKVIMAQGGAIIFDSEEGKGSTFGFTFPKSMLATPVTS